MWLVYMQRNLRGAAHLGDVAGEEKAHYDINRGKMQTLSEENSN